MIKSFILITAIGVTSFIYTDIEGSSVFRGIVLPVVDVMSLVAIAIWFVMMFHQKGISQTIDSGGGDGGGFGGGGDC